MEIQDLARIGALNREAECIVVRKGVGRAIDSDLAAMEPVAGIDPGELHRRPAILGDLNGLGGQHLTIGQ